MPLLKNTSLNHSLIARTLFVFGLAYYLLIQSQSISANETIIRAAVAEEFKGGLQSHYLKYIANQLDMDIRITTMPFARRILEVQKGNLDIIVGLDYSQQRTKELIFIYPAYEKLSFRFFALNSRSNDIKNYEDLIGKIIGVIRGAQYYVGFEQDKSLKKYNLKSLDNGINMLLHGRIDLLIHYEESTLAMLTALNVADRISKTYYQPKHSNEHYIAISKKSPLVNKQQQLKVIIEKGIKQQDFIQMRLKHYHNETFPE